MAWKRYYRKRFYRNEFRTRNGIRQKRLAIYDPSSDKVTYTKWRRDTHLRS